MKSVVPSKGGAPMPINSDFVASNDRNVDFINFKTDHTELRPEHDAFIDNILVPFYISQIEALGFFDKTMTIHPVGNASATGPKDHNMTLSIGRARAVGAAVKKHFDEQKSGAAIAKNVGVLIDPIGKGDKVERDLYGPPVTSPKKYEEKSNSYRSVQLSMLVQHDVDDDDEKILCRQILNAKVKVTTVPANLLEQKIDEIQKKMPPELQAALKEFTDSVKGVAKKIATLMLEGAEFLGPEVFIIFKGIEFIVPSDIALLFEFKDSRARTKQYIFTGSANKIDIGALEIFCQMLSIIKWMTQLPESLKKFEEELEADERKLNFTHEQIDKLKSAIDQAKKFAGVAKKIFDAVTGPNSLFRKIFGDGVTDLIVKAVNSGSSALLGEAEVATEFAPVRFDIKGVFDIFLFGNQAAQVDTNEHRGSPTTVALDFGAPKNQPLLGFQAHAVMHRKFALSFSLASAEISRGTLVPH